MKKIMIILLVIIILAGGIFMITSLVSKKGDSKAIKNPEVLTWDNEKNYKVSVTVPKEKGYEFVDKQSEKAPYEDSLVDFTLVGEKFIIAFEAASYTYQTSYAYKEKYGENDKPNFEEYKKMVEEKLNSLQGKIVQVNGEDVVERSIGSEIRGVQRVINADGKLFNSAEKGGMLIADIYPTDPSVEIDTLLQDEEVKAIIDSIKIEAK